MSMEIDGIWPTDEEIECNNNGVKMRDAENKMSFFELIDRNGEPFAWLSIFFTFMLCVVIVSYININENIEISNNQKEVISKLVDKGYDPLIASCTISSHSDACMILASRYNETDIKKEVVKIEKEFLESE